jgi:hypothetical protein
MLAKKLTACLIGLLMVGTTALAADEVQLNPSHPERYTVVRGDTLWDISGRFLQTPWLWPEVWYVNPQIENPHLIYPGDVIVLSFVDGKPRLSVERGGGHGGGDGGLSGELGQDGRLSPRAIELPLDAAIPTLPLDAIQQFLTQTRVMTKEQLKSAPYVLIGEEEHLLTGAGDRLYARGKFEASQKSYDFVRPGDPYQDPDTGEILGYEAFHLGNGRLDRVGNPATFQVLKSNRELRSGDRLIPANDKAISTHFQPHPPAKSITGKIIAVMDGVVQIGQFQVVVLNRGEKDGIDVGTVLAVYQTGPTVTDTIKNDGEKPEQVKLPDERAGELMVFRTFDRLSFGLIMRATRSMHILDRVTNP